jgi:ABC-type ATPase involved in cell division
MARRIMYLFEELSKAGTTILFATHSDALVREFPHRQLWLYDGLTRFDEEKNSDGSRPLPVAV